MKSLMKISAVLILTFSCMFGSALASTTDTHAIGIIQITDEGTAYFRPEGLGKWGGDDCPDATFVYIGSTAIAYDMIISLAVASKLNGAPMHFQGTCTANGNYLLINYAFLK